MKKTLTALAAVLAACAACAAAPAKSSNAIARLLNARASGSPRSYAEAAETVAKEAAEGRPLQQFVIALVADEASAPAAARLAPEVRRQYLDRARDKIRALAEKKGNALAWYLLSLENKDLQMLRRAADGGNVQALNAYGTITLTQALTDPDASEEARGKAVAQSCACFRRAADEGDPNGLYNLGMCHLNAYGVPQNRAEALRLFRMAAEVGHPEAINNIGGFYREGIEVERDVAAAARWFLKSAEMGNPYGQLNYALALQRGEGVEKDVAKAVEIFRNSAGQGNAEAMNAYGMCLFNGTGVAQDRKAAVAWYRRSAAAGFPPAMDNLATCFELGAGGLPKDAHAATVWKVRGRAARGDGNAAVWLSKNGEPLREEARP